MGGGRPAQPPLSSNKRNGLLCQQRNQPVQSSTRSWQSHGPFSSVKTNKRPPAVHCVLMSPITSSQHKGLHSGDEQRRHSASPDASTTRSALSIDAIGSAFQTDTCRRQERRSWPASAHSTAGSIRIVRSRSLPERQNNKPGENEMDLWQVGEQVAAASALFCVR